MKTIQPNDNLMNYIPRRGESHSHQITDSHQMNSPKSNSAQSNSTQKYFPNKNRANAIRPYQIRPIPIHHKKK